MSAYFVWARKDRLRQLADKPSVLGLVLLAAGVGILIVGNAAAELFTMRVSLLVILTGLILYLLGPEHLRILAFPTLYLIFMIPPPALVFNAVALPLQLFAARMATTSLEFLSIPVLREGNLITLADTTLEVAEACSGIRSLITLLALAVTYAYFTQQGTWRRIILCLSAIPVAIIANAARVAGTGILAHFFGMQAAQGFFHNFSGWLIFMVATVLLVAEGFLLSKLPQHRKPFPIEAMQAVSAQEQPGQSQALRERGRLTWWRLSVAAAVLVMGVLFLRTLSHGEAVPLRRQLDGFPLRVGQWQGMGEALPPSVLSVLRVTDYIMRLYGSPPGPPISLYVGYYESQRQGQTYHSPRVCLPGSGWNIVSHQDLTVRLPGRPEPVAINRVLVRKGEDRQVVLYWYQERGRIIASEYAAKLYLAADAIRRNRTDGALVRLSAPVRGSEEETLQQLLGFTRLIFPSLTEFLPG
jgi:exosortase D (VPLPA-CTERM-specific)